MISNAMAENRIGKFTIPASDVLTRPNVVQRLLGQCLITRAEYQFITNSFHYDAYSDLFDQVPCHEIPAEYTIYRTISNGQERMYFWPYEDCPSGRIDATEKEESQEGERRPYTIGEVFSPEELKESQEKGAGETEGEKEKEPLSVKDFYEKYEKPHREKDGCLKNYKEEIQESRIHQEDEKGTISLEKEGQEEPLCICPRFCPRHQKESAGETENKKENRPAAGGTPP